jgi:hypothetical protein
MDVIPAHLSPRQRAPGVPVPFIASLWEAVRASEAADFLPVSLCLFESLQRVEIAQSLEDLVESLYLSFS